MREIKKGIITLMLMSFACMISYAQSTLNLDFEYYSMHTKKPSVWLVNDGNLYETSIDSTISRSNKNSLLMKFKGKNFVDGYHSFIYNCISRDIFKGDSSLKFSGYIKTENITEGSAEIYIYVAGLNNKLLASADMEDNPIVGTIDWKKYTLELPIDTSAFKICFGASNESNGNVWFDNFELYLDNKKYVDIEMIQREPSKDEINWLKENIVTISTVEAENGLEDLLPLKDIIGHAKIVSLGECTHGSGEIFRMKHRIIEYLVTEMGFTIFSIEANMPESYKINEYVLNGNGDPKELLKGLRFWTWNTQEVLDMIEWMRNFNKAGKGQIQFTGFDMQYTEEAIKNIEKFSKKTDYELLKMIDKFKTIKQRIDSIRNTTRSFIVSDSIITQNLLSASKEIYNYLDLNNLKLVNSVEITEFEWIKQNAKILKQYSALTNDPNLAINYRDKCMAENVTWILENNSPNSKIILWGHNSHINIKEGSMGGYLEKKYGKEHYAIGFATNKGTYSAFGENGLGSYDLLTSEIGSYEYYFKSTNIPMFFLDLASIDCNNKLNKILCSEMNFRDIGAMATESQFFQKNIKDLFDGIIFINKTSPSNCFFY